MPTENKAFRADWKKRSEYPQIGCSDYRELAWEFIRRNSEYAKAVSSLEHVPADEFENGFEKTSETCLDGITCSPPARAGESAKKYYERMKARGKSAKIPKPTALFSTQWLLSRPILVNSKYDDSVRESFSKVVKIRTNEADKAKIFRLAIKPNQIAVLFNMNVNFDKQIAEARGRFSEAQEKYSSKISAVNSETARPKKNKRIKGIENAHLWLRCYDALADLESRSTSQREVGEFLQREFHEEEAKGRKYGDNKKSPGFSAIEIRTYLDAAKSYIEEEKFAILYFEENFSPKTHKK